MSLKRVRRNEIVKKLKKLGIILNPLDIFAFESYGDYFGIHYQGTIDVYKEVLEDD